MSSDEEPIGEEFVLKWRIEDFNMCPFQNREFVKSPEITLKTFYNTTWYLKVFPREVKRRNEKNVIEFISCYLVRAKSDDGPRSIDISYKLSVNSAEKEARMKPFTNEKGWGGKFLKRESSLICCELLDVECYMRLNANYSANEENDNEPSTLIETKLFPSAGERQDSSVLSNRCFIHSKVSVENRTFICPIQDIDQRLPTLSFLEDRNLTATLHLEKNSEDCEDYLSADIRFNEVLNKNLFTVCSMQILDSYGEIFKTTEDEYLFTKEYENEVWHFAKPFLWNEVKEEKNSHLCFEFSVSDGQIRSNLEWLLNVNYHPKFSSSKYLPKGFLKEMFRFYKEIRYCDVTLATKDQIFHCHKTVLCAQSPVLAAIFEGGMKDYEDNIIPIKDVDSEVMSQMIDYMYTSKVEDWKFATAMKLFSAAEKYKIDSLKRTCCDFLTSILSCENVCQILRISQAVKDDHLKQLAISFISVHKSEIFSSLQWKELAEENIYLAYEILMKLAPTNNFNRAQETEGSD